MKTLFTIILLISSLTLAQGKQFSCQDTTRLRLINELINGYENDLSKNIESENWTEARVDVIMLDGLYENKLFSIARQLQKVSKDYAFTLEEIGWLARGEKDLHELRSAVKE